MRQWLAFVRKEFYHVFRDRRTLLICAHTSVYAVRMMVPGLPHPWERAREAEGVARAG